MLRVFLIRHAESNFNRLGKGQGWKFDSNLSRQGIIQAKKLAKRLSKHKIDKIYSSDFKRAFNTAKEIARYHNLEVIQDKDLREFNKGNYNLYRDYRIAFEKLYKKQIAKGKSKYEIRLPGAENIWDLIKRVKSFLKKLSKEKGTVIVVAHGGINRVFVNLMKGITNKDKFEIINHHNTGISFIEYKNKKWKIRKINCTRHLCR